MFPKLLASETKWKKQMFSFMEGKPENHAEISVSHANELFWSQWTIIFVIPSEKNCGTSV